MSFKRRMLSLTFLCAVAFSTGVLDGCSLKTDEQPVEVNQQLFSWKSGSGDAK